MKKLFLAFTAFVGMLTGISLTSCGGGGGGSNLVGTVLYMTKPGYKIIFNEQVDGIANTYVADITDPAEDHYTRALMTFSSVKMDNGKLESATGSLVSECFNDPDYAKVYVWMFGTTGEVDAQSITATASGDMFTLTAKGDGTVTIVWQFSAKPYWTDSDDVKHALIPPSDDQNGTTTEGGNDDDDDNDEVNGGDSDTHYGYILRY